MRELKFSHLLRVHNEPNLTVNNFLEYFDKSPEFRKFMVKKYGSIERSTEYLKSDDFLAGVNRWNKNTHSVPSSYNGTCKAQTEDLAYFFQQNPLATPEEASHHLLKNKTVHHI